MEGRNLNYYPLLIFFKMSFPVLCGLLGKKITATSFYPEHTVFGLLDLPVLCQP